MNEDEEEVFEYVADEPETPLRDQFAMAALTGLARFYVEQGYSADWVAIAAYMLADAMLDKRKTEK